MGRRSTKQPKRSTSTPRDASSRKRFEPASRGVDSADDPPAPTRVRWPHVALLILCGFSAYASSLRAGFVFDDLGRIVENGALQSARVVGDYVLRSPVRSVVRFSLAANYALGGLDPVGYHLFNLAVHLAAGLLLYGLVRRTLLLPRYRERFGPQASWLALAVASVWLVHPLGTQAVTYVIQRAESLMALFFLLMLYCLVRSHTSSRRWPWYAGGAVSFVLGLASKLVMVTALPVALLYDCIFLTGSIKEALRKRGRLYALLLLPLVGFSLQMRTALAESGDKTGVGGGIHTATAWEYARTQPQVILHYLRLALWPDALLIDYDWPVAETPAEIVVPAALLAMLLAGSLFALWRAPGLAFLGLSFFLVLGPTSSILPIRDLAVEHRMYLPLALVVAAAVMVGFAGFRRLAEWQRLSAATQTTILGLSLGVVVVALGVRTCLRNRDYRSEITLWSSAVAVQPQNGRAVHNLAVAWEKAGRMEQAIAVAVAALGATAERGLPTWEHRVLLGELLTRAGDAPRAAAHLEAAAAELEQRDARDPATKDHLAKTYLSLGAAYDFQGDFAAAERYYRRALKLNPEDASAYAMLGGAMIKQPGSADEAVEAWKNAARLKPDWFEVHRDLALVLQALGRREEALVHLRKAVELRPSDPQLTQMLAEFTADASG